MSKKCAQILGIALAAATSTANAAIVSIEWNSTMIDEPGESATFINVQPGDVMRYDLSISLLQGDTLAGLATRFNPSPQGDVVSVFDNNAAAIPPGWEAVVDEGLLSNPDTFAGAAATLPLTDSITGPGR